ncbi:MAG TPA: hypothetical protein VMZ53_29970, partial [Kofleriaceae bacterium]|nr:hypothetical protein [Kofleriaceae bacterium]
RLIAAYVRLAMDHLELADMVGYAQVAIAYTRLAERFGAAAGPWRVPLMHSMLALARDDFAESQRQQDAAAALDPENPRARRARAFHRICFLRAAERHAHLRASIGELRSLWAAMPYGAKLAEARVAGSLMRVGADDEVRAIVATLTSEAWDEEINFISLAEAVWCTADREHATRLLPGVRKYQTRWMAYWLDVEILEFPTARLVAYLEGIAGNWDACDDLFATALRDVEQLGKRSGIARMKFELGDLMLRCKRDVDRARVLISEARVLAAEVHLDELVAMIDRRHRDRRHTQPPRKLRGELAIVREGEYYAITRGAATLRFKATRGFQYLEQLVERAGVDIHVLDLMGSADADRGDAGEVIDAKALHTYRERADALRDVLEDAEQRGDAIGAEQARSELEALATELSRGTSLGGKVRRSESAVDRARSAVQRRIKDALDRIAEQDAELGAWLRRVVHTGNYCSFQGNV